MLRNVIVKVTLGCNIDCTYCYVRRNRETSPRARVMDRPTLELLIRRVGEYLTAQSTAPDQFILYWHGGEPLMAGTAFFEQSRELQDRYIPSNIPVVNVIQTNATLLTDRWARTISDIGFGVCLSLDGPRDVNDVWRRRRDGGGTYDLIVRGIETLRRNGIPISILGVITPEALPHGTRIYQAFRELGCTWMDFMYPFYSRIDNTLDQSISPALWGDFLVDVFDAWLAEANPAVEVRLLKDLCMQVLGGKTVMCISGVDCSYVITVNPDGRVFVCDDLLAYTDSELGNIDQRTFEEIAQHPKLIALSDQEFLFGDECRSCDLFRFCRGGCTLFRARAKGDFHGRHYYCDAQRRIVSHIYEYFERLSAASVA